MNDSDILNAIEKAKIECEKFLPKTEEKAQEMVNDEKKFREYLIAASDACEKVHEEVKDKISLEDFANLFSLHVQYNFIGLTQINPNEDATIELK